MNIHSSQNYSQMVSTLDDYFKTVLSSQKNSHCGNFDQLCRPFLNQLFAMFNGWTLPIMVNSYDKKCVYANNAFLQTMQLTQDEITNFNCSQITSATNLSFTLDIISKQQITVNMRKYNIHSFPFGNGEQAQKLFVHFFELDPAAFATSPEVRNVFIQTIQAIAQTLEQRDPYTAGHQKRVGQLARAIGQELNLDEYVLEGLEFGGLIHDVGKIQVPSDILSKPGKLRKEEMDLIKLHPQSGYEIIKDIKFPWPIGDIVLQHHERLDGSGYPNQLHDRDICFEAKIIAVADVVEAMSSHRPYRPALGLDVTMSEIENKSKIFFDPAVVEACLNLFQNKNFEFASA